MADQQKIRYSRIAYTTLKERYNVYVFSVRGNYVAHLGLPSRFWTASEDRSTESYRNNQQRIYECESQGIPVTRYDAGLPQGLHAYIGKYYESGKLKQIIKVG
jgi:hypothetical protein